MWLSEERDLQVEFLMPLYRVPVKCEKCHQVALVINPGDKVYCLHCDHNYRLPSFSTLWPGPDDVANNAALRYYINQLENFVLAARGVDVQQFRLWNVDGRPTPLSECKNPECPVGCPDDHAATPEYLRMIEAED